MAVGCERWLPAVFRSGQGWQRCMHGQGARSLSLSLSLSKSLNNWAAATPPAVATASLHWTAAVACVGEIIEPVIVRNKYQVVCERENMALGSVQEFG